MGTVKKINDCIFIEVNEKSGYIVYVMCYMLFGWLDGWKNYKN